MFSSSNHRLANVRLYLFFVCQLPWKYSFSLSAEDLARRTTTMTAVMGGNDKLSPNNGGLTNQRLAVTTIGLKLSTTSSTTSIEHSNFCTRLYRKCQMVCCICTPNYL